MTRGAPVPTKLRSRLVRVAAALALGATVIALGLQLAAAEDRAVREIERRTDERVILASHYVDTFLQDMRARQVNYARRQLGGRDVTAERFDDAVVSFGFEASVLLDGDGRVLAVSPQKPDLVGTKIADEYPHLAAAVAGTPAVSDVVLSAAEQKPIVAVAVPFETPAGRRVISGGYELSKTPLASFLGAASSLRGRELYLVDGQGLVVAGTEVLTDPSFERHAPELAGAGAGSDTLDYRGEGFHVIRTPVANTDWRLVAAFPTRELLEPADQGLVPWLLVGAAAVLALLVLALLQHVFGQRDNLYRLSRTDLLTELPNRLQATSFLTHVSAVSHRSGRPWAVAVIDIDHFKQVNDTLGHAAGDGVLRDIADTLHRAARASDFLARWGGEEFLLVMPDTDTIGAVGAAERMAAAVRENVAAGGVTCTVSVGVAVRAGATPDTLIDEADGALYRAKAFGRDRVEMSVPADITDLVDPVDVEQQ